MRRSLLDALVDPISREALSLLEVKCNGDDEIVEGILSSPTGRRFPILNGIPRFVVTQDSGQHQTGLSFGFKWERRSSYDSPRPFAFGQEWLVRRYGFKRIEEMREYFCGRKMILDAGCGSGFSTSLWSSPSWDGPPWLGVDISSAIDVARERLAFMRNAQFLQADVLQLPLKEQCVDTVFSEGVLHHTPSTERALKALVPVLERGGEILFYVYRKKGPIREFSDDYIRGVVSRMSPEEAWRALEPLTRLGETLTRLRAEVEVMEDIPYLGIKAGRYDLQRLIYWNFVKLFWNVEFTFEENTHVNFDWYHPRYAHRHTEEELYRWCAASGLSILHFNVGESGFTVRAKRI